MVRVITEEAAAGRLFQGKRVSVLGMMPYGGNPVTIGLAKPVITRAELTNETVRYGQIWDRMRVGQSSVVVEQVIYHPMADAKDLVMALLAGIAPGDERVVVPVLECGPLTLKIVREFLCQCPLGMGLRCEVVVDARRFQTFSPELAECGVVCHLHNMTLLDLLASPMAMQALAVRYPAPN